MKEQHFSTDIANTSVPSASVTDTSPFEAVGAEEAIAHERTRKHLRHARATPLASIFGSGFLVIVPILYHFVRGTGGLSLPGDEHHL